MTLLTQTTKEVAPAQLMPAWTLRRWPARRPHLHHAAGRHQYWPWYWRPKTG